MLEKFTPEEIEQIKKELDSSKASFKNQLVKGEGPDVVFPFSIHGIENMNYKMHDCVYSLTDAIVGNYILRKSTAKNSDGKVRLYPYGLVHAELTQAWKDVYNEIDRLIVRLANRYENTRRIGVNKALGNKRFIEP